MGKNPGGVTDGCPNFQNTFNLMGFDQYFQVVANLWKNNGYMIGFCNEPQPLKGRCFAGEQAANIIFYVIWYNITHGLLRFLVSHVLLNIGVMSFQRFIEIELAGIHIGYKEQILSLGRVDGCVDGAFPR